MAEMLIAALFLQMLAVGAMITRTSCHNFPYATTGADVWCIVQSK